MTVSTNSLRPKRNKSVFWVLTIAGVIIANACVAFAAANNDNVKIDPVAKAKSQQEAGEVFFGYIRLLGTVFNSDETGEKREAVIANIFNKQKETYIEGSFLPCGVKLKQVKKDSVILEKNGKLKTLSLNDKNNYFKEIKVLMKYGYHRIAPGEWIISPHYLFKSSEELINIAKNSELAFAPSDNNGSGLNINNLSDDSKIVKLGFKPGDKVVNVNGVELKGFLSLAEAYKKMSGSDSVKFKIQRDGKPVDISFWIGPKGSPRYDMEDVYEAVKQLFVM